MKHHQQPRSAPIQRSDDKRESQSNELVPITEGHKLGEEVREAVSWYLARGALRVAEKLVVKQQ